MGEVLQAVSVGWPEGVNTTIPADQIPSGGSPRAHNSALISVDDGVAAVRKRKGIRMMNATAVSGSAPFIGQVEFRYLDPSTRTFTNYHLAFTDTGRIELVPSTPGSLTNVSTALTSGTYYPMFAQANNCLFIVNGQDRKKIINLTGTLTLQNFGIAEPSTAPTLADAGTAGNHNGTYEGFFTYVNGNTGEESSAGLTSATVTVANKKINWTSVTASADGQVTKRNLYIRNTGTMNQFYLVGSINDNSTTTATTDVLDTSLVTVGPDQDSNDRPPSGVTYIAWHINRMFVADDTTLYYSNDGHPEEFDSEATKPVNPKDGQKITGIWSLNQTDLLIGKSDSMWLLRGQDPNTWDLEVLFPDIGCSSFMSLTIVDGVIRWWSRFGPMEWDQSGPPIDIGHKFVDNTVGESGINYSRLNQICSAADQARHRTFWLVPESGQTRNTKILPYNNRLRRWEADTWDPMDSASIAVATDTNGFPQVYIGNYGGQIFRMWDTENDGVASGTMTGTFSAGAATVTTVTDSGAAFDTTGAALKERKVTILDSSGRMMGSTRPRISSNTSTSFTMASSVGGLAIGATYTYIIGGPAFEFDTHWESFAKPFTKKRWEFFYLQSEASVSSTALYIDIAFDLDSTDRRALIYTSPAGAVWGSFLWGHAVWGGLTSALKRFRIAKVGTKARARIFNFQANQSFTLYRVGFRAEARGDKGL